MTVNGPIRSGRGGRAFQQEHSMNKGKGKELAQCARNHMLFGVAETKENTGTSKRKAWKGQAYTTEVLKMPH